MQSKTACRINTKIPIVGSEKMSLIEIQNQLKKLADKKHAMILQRFFKTGTGEYGEGDEFMGIKVPPLRKLAADFDYLSLTDAQILLNSKFHEERLLALLILVRKFRNGEMSEQKEIFDLYLTNTGNIDNWDLVDVSAEHIVGAWLYDKSKTPLYNLSKSQSLWERRISIMSTFHYIKRMEFSETLKISRIFLKDEEDLIHKAVGWMLREIGKRDLDVEEKFLKAHYKSMPRTMLRYAIEKFPESKRQDYLKGNIREKLF